MKRNFQIGFGIGAALLFGFGLFLVIRDLLIWLTQPEVQARIGPAAAVVAIFGLGVMVYLKFTEDFRD